jgi:hypothetical protein
MGNVTTCNHYEPRLEPFLYWTSIQYIVLTVDPQQWIERCAARLHEQWPRLPDDQLREVAEQLRRDAERHLDEPERAAADWLRLGIPRAR